MIIPAVIGLVLGKNNSIKIASTSCGKKFLLVKLKSFFPYQTTPPPCLFLSKRRLL